ncbi:MAG TPA: protein-export chaperone SecB [Candidatus Stercoripulliclostridium merdipullorum]|uniref:Protein-export chaperone SecB n=1 Tax=Candidatus Stercoripulliclostridium merdipullorum TaxID=2840952 RepID=A0A9D1SWV3_9FIRM|nr:protein-export chaperone SecB [Candidatus Stercoripulliclostridium merdipullorum]
MKHLNFLQYRLENVDFRVVEENLSGVKFAATPRLTAQCARRGNQYLVKMTVEIENDGKSNVMPFDLKVTAACTFHIVADADVETLRLEASEFVYPYLRASVTSIVTAANFPPHFLPPVDFGKVIRGAEPKESGGSVIVRPLVDLD